MSTTTHTERPLVTLLLAAYAQEAVIPDAVRAALAQTYAPLEIIVSDDASPDGTYAAMEHAVKDYRGPHRVILRRNPRNLGISGHFSALAELAQGELLCVAAGDDLSAPTRCADVVEHWLALDKRPDLIATDLVDIDAAGQPQGVIRHSHLNALTLVDWLAARPWLVGASHVWSKRLFTHFGPLREGAHAEDQIMLLRALLSGGAVTLHAPLVRWRRGGLSAKRRHASLAALLAHMRRGNAAGLAEIAQLLADAEVVGEHAAVQAALAPRLAREHFVQAMLAPGTPAGQRLRLALRSREVPAGYRLRLLGYTTLPWLYDPVLRLKAAARVSRHGDAAGRSAS